MATVHDLIARDQEWDENGLRPLKWVLESWAEEIGVPLEKLGELFSVWVAVHQVELHCNAPLPRPIRPEADLILWEELPDDEAARTRIRAARERYDSRLRQYDVDKAHFMDAGLPRELTPSELASVCFMAHEGRKTPEQQSRYETALISRGVFAALLLAEGVELPAFWPGLRDVVAAWGPQGGHAQQNEAECEARPATPTASIKKGPSYPGRSSMLADVMDEMRRRATKGDLCPVLAEECRHLAGWAENNRLPGVNPPTAKTIENACRGLYRTLSSKQAE